MAVEASPGVGVAVAESLIRDLGRVSEWYDFWRMKFNASKTKTMIVSRPRTMHPQSRPVTISGTVLKKSDDIFIFKFKFKCVLLRKEIYIEHKIFNQLKHDQD